MRVSGNQPTATLLPEFRWDDRLCTSLSISAMWLRIDSSASRGIRLSMADSICLWDCSERRERSADSKESSRLSLRIPAMACVTAISAVFLVVAAMAAWNSASN